MHPTFSEGSLRPALACPSVWLSVSLSLCGSLRPVTFCVSPCLTSTAKPYTCPLAHGLLAYSAQKLLFWETFRHIRIQVNFLGVPIATFALVHVLWRCHARLSPLNLLTPSRSFMSASLPPSTLPGIKQAPNKVQTEHVLHSLLKKNASRGQVCHQPGCPPPARLSFSK